MTGTDTAHVLFRTGIDYYITGRAAARAQRLIVAGNLLHHAVELMLKSDLSKSLPLTELKDKYGHKLGRTWGAFKALHPGESLSGFDQLIADLDRFEDIRYPDHYMKHGAEVSVGWATLKPVQLAGQTTPRYELYINEVDSLVARLFDVCLMNPLACLHPLNAAARDALEHMNEACSGWTGVPSAHP